MKIIKGFKTAKLILSRPAPGEVFGGDAREQVVRQIIDDVRNRGDRAVLDYAKKFDGVELASLEVNKKQIRNAYQKVDSELVSALKLAARRIRSFHLKQKRLIWRIATPGSVQIRAAGEGRRLCPRRDCLLPINGADDSNPGSRCRG